MQLYTNAAGFQKLLTEGSIGRDADTITPENPLGDYLHPVIWDTLVDGGEIDPAKVGGYSRVNNALVYSQEAFDAQETAQQTALVQETRQLAKEVIQGNTPLGLLLRSVILVTMDELNDLRLEFRTMDTNGANAPANVAGMRAVFTSIRPMLDRNGSQAITAVENKITDGLAD